MRQFTFRSNVFAAAVFATVLGALATGAHAQLLLYEPFNYTVGQNLGGTDPDGPGGASGFPTQGQTGSYVGGGSYKWRAHGTVSNYQANNDAVVSAGNLSYAGLAPSMGSSVSYGSNTDNNGLYVDAIPLGVPGGITSGSLYASFIIRIKSNLSGNNPRHSPAGLLFETSSDGNAGAALTPQGGTAVNEPGMFWMRKNVSPPIEDTNFSPSKSSGDGIGAGGAGPSAGWQHPSSSFQETNQFGNKSGQAPADFNTPATWQTYFVVLKYEFDATNTDPNDVDPSGSTPGLVNGQQDVVSLWMNPGSGTLGVANGEVLASQDASGNLGSYYAAIDAYGTAGNDSVAINSFALFGHRQNTVATVAVDFDELRIGTTWASVTPTAREGDYNGNGSVDAADYVLWRKGVQPLPSGEVATIGTTDASDYTAWWALFGNTNPGAGGGGGTELGAIPEPSSVLTLLPVVAAWFAVRRSRS